MVDKISINLVLPSSKVRPIFVAKDSRAEKASLNALSDLPVMPVSLVWVDNCRSDAFCTQHSTTHEGSTRSNQPPNRNGAIPETTSSQCGDKTPPITFELNPFTFTVLTPKWFNLKFDPALSLGWFDE
ncbi:hypothetical protein TNIN_254321 [Trichonephila inaurata madagascariensis]|uniref:Uncharacterized protein n=1 Tax=Trichonephila inaurata madagascariensis TaxID=2747483 RepID=A0A8X6XVW9_9ARAC|nr:hypothetical protein TNIN_254321 [Trichonephila inaurata madagascariensis]